MALVFVNIGSNLGDRRRNISRAVAEIGRRFGYFELSHIMESEAWGYDSAHKFLNIAMVFKSDEEPLEILHALQKIEKELGDTLAKESGNPAGNSHRDAAGGYADRYLDIDIMTIEGVRMQSEELTLPHPHLRERKFFMEPLQELLDQIPGGNEIG